MRTVLAICLSGLLIGSTSVVSAADSSAPLAAGHPAGVKQAQALGPNALLLILGAGVVIGGIALVVSNGSNNAITTSTTSTRGLHH